jgi:tellurite resistance protein TerC
MTYPLSLWIFFNGFVLLILALDLGVFHKKAYEIRLREAVIWSGIWISLALVFNGLLYLYHGKADALEFLTAYLIEKSLSIDNIFVFLTVFTFFKVPEKYQHKVLFWGILGALAMRGAFIFGGIELIERFHWIIYLFGIFLVFTGIKMLVREEKSPDFDQSLLIRGLKKILPFTAEMGAGKFIVNRKGKRYVTALFLVLVIVEATDLLFAVDSIPAVLAVTNKSFIAYTSNVFAILGLRSLYFALAGFLRLFPYLRYGLSGILIFVGAKMTLKDLFDIPTSITFAVIMGILLLTILVSKVRKKV